MLLLLFLYPADFPQSAENKVRAAHLKGSVLALWVALLISLSCAVADEPGDKTANHKACYCQHSSEPYWHRFFYVWFVAFSDGEAVDIREDVRMLLKTHTKKHNDLTHYTVPSWFWPRTLSVPLNQMQVSSDVWDAFHYLSGAFDVSGICEIVICLFSPHRLQLGMKQRTPLAGRSLVKQASAKPFISPDSPCYSTELQPWKRVPARRNGNSPLRRRWHQVCSPGKKILISVCAPGSVQLVNLCMRAVQRGTYSTQRDDGVLKEGLHNHGKVLSAVIATAVHHVFSLNLMGSDRKDSLKAQSPWRLTKRASQIILHMWGHDLLQIALMWQIQI